MPGNAERVGIHKKDTSPCSANWNCFQLKQFWILYILYYWIDLSCSISASHKKITIVGEPSNIFLACYLLMNLTNNSRHIMLIIVTYLLHNYIQTADIYWSGRWYSLQLLIALSEWNQQHCTKRLWYVKWINLFLTGIKKGGKFISECIFYVL